MFKTFTEGMNTYKLEIFKIKSLVGSKVSLGGKAQPLHKVLRSVAGSSPEQ